jgi:hypothetical protein
MDAVNGGGGVIDVTGGCAVGVRGLVSDLESCQLVK